MKITRLYTDEHGETHFEDREVELTPTDFAPPMEPFDVSAPVSAEQLVFVGLPAGGHGDWHVAPRRQYWVGIKGRLDVTASDGETRRFGPGSVVLLDDVSGKGHVTRILDGTPAQGVFIQL